MDLGASNPRGGKKLRQETKTGPLEKNVIRRGCICYGTEVYVNSRVAGQKLVAKKEGTILQRTG